MRVEEVAQELGISKSHAYKVIHQLNAELRDKGYLTISGRVNRNCFIDVYKRQDEPLLHTMFVDKKLSGVKAVQTLVHLLSVLNCV